MLLICFMYLYPVNSLLIRTLSFLLLTILSGTYVLNAQNSSEKSHKVLVVHSYHQGYYWTDEISKGIFETFSNNQNTEVFIKFMDVIRDKSIQHFQLLDDTEVSFSMVVDVNDRYEAEAKVKRAYIWAMAFALIGLIVLSVFILLLLKNIKSRILAEKELQESEKRYRELFNNVLDIVFSCDLKGNVLTINKTAFDTLGVNAIVGRNINEFLSLESRHSIWLNLKNAIRKGKREFTLETQISDLHGIIIHMEVNGHIKYTKQGKPLEIFAIARNNNAQKEINRNILKTVIKTEEKERRRIAAELHDGIGPLLSGLKMYLQQDSLIENMAPPQAKILSYSQQLVDDAIQQARSIANNLTPGILNDFGLEKALTSFITKVNALEKCEVKFETSTGLSRLASDESLVIYRVITELINNALKHATSQEIVLHIELIGNTLLMFYSDDGKGFDVEEVLNNPEKNGMGIANIFNRINTLDGKIVMDRQRSGKGMFANITIPIGRDF
jgi:PAS domain S-box-containing protein